MLESQTLLLFESIRRYTGRFSGCTLYAVSPRAGHAISKRARRELDRLGAIHVDRVLNTECTEYGSANRVAAAGYIEETYSHDILVVLDSDTLFLREPSEILLSSNVDAAVRPVDLKGMSTNGPADHCDGYWRELCECCGVDYDAIPLNESFVDRERIKANYNGGLVIVRGSLGILQTWAEFFFRSIRKGLKPHANASSFRTGAGWIQPAAANLWGSNQAALSLAIWSASPRVQELPSSFNYPLTLHSQIGEDVVRTTFPELVHVHYHWLLSPDSLAANPLFNPDGPLSAAQMKWLRRKTPLC